MKRLIILILASVISLSILFFVFSKHQETKKYLQNNTVLIQHSYILMGDTGTGNSNQSEVAEGVKSYCSFTQNCKAVFMLGDVIYDEGVTGIKDEQFLTKFEKPYADISLPFYILFGNHDYIGCTSCYLEYDKLSTKWEIPARFYLQNYKSVSFYAIDTENFDNEQKSWLINQLSQNSSKWKIVLGHRPIKTFEETKLNEKWNGDEELKKILCNFADFYISGHSHILEDAGQVENCRVRQFISGTGGSYPRNVKKPYEGKFYFEDNGFLALTVSGKNIRFEFFDKTGNSLYNFTAEK
ncbi:hypothetical protein A2715_03150 [Candidatus Woesebacteria bacterium RIFCSPHIGHO2_01_FULL_39_32]|uniref:Acid phosphatase 5, tartrate resistant n=2 Tax=Candidatus Woeseibacteriota TaxID=1752722 RepID=A0A0G0S6D3_9BACT|nr:MAG: Acid phosphatase 5, tartrate resistant [Candidatus Woesebacteria bacterium GW2011_GWA1_39_8]OGM04917.1 MAG: hypothetical protein A2124_05595 [Candidatus Woesebacteria bacterium GWB1_37_5]OGM24738.1 MAG: hypothetical protein A2715_03150 [Candidatus Woesebacteria bacterium RIFCSPHIGHO2_01_FULL_39_32]OGM38193.1 MAG: hypothetical protein A3F01_00920 [Candidatus Woesebacteria bacterium RIFCSPHIGHO2_12_FULL_38_11]OGM64564.1 MAG: hypothetical protein A2893_06065 [Candidatus Woesebacteria bacte